MNDISGFWFAGVLMAAVFIGCGWVVKRHWIDHAWSGRTNRFIGRQVLSGFQTDDDRKRMEYVHYQEEDEREEEEVEQGKDRRPGISFFEPDDNGNV